MILKPKYEGCDSMIKAALGINQMVRCYLWGDHSFIEKSGKLIRNTTPEKQKGWVIDYLPFDGHRYKAILDLDIKQIVYFQNAEAIKKEEVELTR